MKFETLKLSERFGAVLHGYIYSEKAIREAITYAETPEVVEALERMVYGETLSSDFHLLGGFECDLNDKGL